MSLSGVDFEKIVKPFFENVFVEIGFRIVEIRNQQSGTQNGFDIKIVAFDLSNKKRHLFIECKNYKSTLVWAEVFGKQLNLDRTNYEVDGFILLSPFVQLSNINDNLKSAFDKNWFKFPSDYWTPDQKIENLFALYPEFHEKIYEKTCPNIDRIIELQRFKDLIEDLFAQKDNSKNTLPVKQNFDTPTDYIERRVIGTNDIEQDFGNKNGKTLSETLYETKKIALLGWAGTGKSIELAYTGSFLANNTPYFPFLIKLCNHTDQSIVDRIPNFLSIPQNLIVLLLDGLDEVQNGKFDEIRRKVLDFSETYPEVMIVISCRSNFYTINDKEKELATLSGFKSYQLANLNSSEIQSYIDKKLLLKNENFVQEVIEKNLRNLLHLPYYLVKLVDQYLIDNKLSDSKAELFEYVIKDNINRDVNRHFPDNRNFMATAMRQNLEKLAFIYECQGKNNGSWTEIQSLFNKEAQEILKHSGSLLDGFENDNSMWKFTHNNIQEYLVAKLLSKQKYETIRSVIFFPKRYTKVKPTWVNVLSFIISVLPENDIVRNKIIRDLCNNEPELVIKFEPDKISENIRYNIFKSIYEYYKKENRIINRTKFSVKELANFIQTRDTVNFLSEEISSKSSLIATGNALEIISYFNIDINFPDLVSKVKFSIENILFGSEGNQYLALRAYNLNFKLTEQDFDKVFKHFEHSDDTWIKYTLYNCIQQQGYQSKYIDYILSNILRCIKKEDENETRLSNEYTELVECIKTTKDLDTVKKILKFIIDNYSSIYHSIYFTEIIDHVLQFVIIENDSDVYELMKSGFISDDVNMYEKQIARFVEYFEKSGNKSSIFKEVYNTCKTSHRHFYFGHLAMLASNENLQFLANEFRNSALTKDEVYNFQYYLPIETESVKYFNDLINKTENVALPQYKDWGKLQDIVNNRTREIIFNKEKFKSAIEDVFQNLKKDSITYDEVLQLYSNHTDEKTLTVVIDTLRKYNKNGTKDKQYILNSIEEKWSDLSIGMIIDLLKRIKIELDSSEIQYIKIWCDKHAQSVDFNTALNWKDDSRRIFNTNAVRLSYLIRKLRFTNYDAKLYLDMLSFFRYDDSEIKIIDFVSAIIPKSKIEERIIFNISRGIKFDFILDDYLEYCVSNKLTKVCDYLIPYINGEISFSPKALECYNKLDGNIKKIEDILTAMTGRSSFFIIEALLVRGSRNLLKSVLMIFENTEDSMDRLLLASYLVTLQSKKGLVFYRKEIERTKKIPDRLSIVTPFAKLTDARLLGEIFKLYEMGYDSDIQQDRFNNLKDLSLHALHSISLFEDNLEFFRKKLFYYSIKFKIKQFIKITKLSEHILPNLRHHYENIEHQYYINKSGNVIASDAVKIYRSLN